MTGSSLTTMARRGTHKTRRSAVAASIALGLALAGCSAPADQGRIVSHHPDGYPDVQASAAGAATCLPTSAAENRAAAQFTSQTRRARGLGALRPRDDLARAAASHACDMARRGLMSHKGSRTSGPMQRVKAEGYAPRLTAENIAAGPYGQSQVLSAWSGSPGHTSNILIPGLRDFGIGRAVGSDGRTVFWSAVYAIPR